MEFNTVDHSWYHSVEHSLFCLVYHVITHCQNGDVGDYRPVANHLSSNTRSNNSTFGSRFINDVTYYLNAARLLRNSAGYFYFLLYNTNPPSSQKCIKVVELFVAMNLA